MSEPVTLFPVSQPTEMELEAFFAAHAEAIRVLAKRTAADIIEIGQRLIAVKAKKNHGEWLRWLKDEFNWTQPTAFNYMHVAEAFGSKLSTLDNLTIDLGALYLLARDDVGEEVRDKIIEHVEPGERITKAKAEELIEAARAEVRAEAKIDQREAIERAVTEYREQQRPLLEHALREATQRLADNNEALTAEIERINASLGKPDVPAIEQTIIRYLGTKAKRLTEPQYELLAQILGQAIAVGRKRFEPVSRQVIQRNEEMLRMTSAISEALENLAGAPPPEAVIEIAWEAQIAQHRRLCGPVIKWLTRYQQLLGEDR